MFLSNSIRTTFCLSLIIFLFSLSSSAQNLGCTDPIACNYDAEATEDDGSCSNIESLMFPESTTLDAAGDAWLRQQMPDFIQNYEAELLYRATEDGFDTDVLIARTTGSSETPNMVFLIKTDGGNVFGVYASNEIYDTVGEYVSLTSGIDFIFSVNNELVDGITSPYPVSYYFSSAVTIAGDIFLWQSYGETWTSSYDLYTGGSFFLIEELEVYAINTLDDSSLTTLTDGQYSGCTDPLACNYDAEADCDNGSCNFIQEGECDCLGNTLDACGVCGGNGTVAGCMDPLACNYDSEVDCSDDSCTYILEGECDCLGNTLDVCGVCGGSSIAGCMDPLACNYDSEVDCSDDSCTYIPEGECDCLGNTHDACGICGGSSIAGCMDPLACNYNQHADCDDGSCSNIEPLMFPGSNTLDAAGDAWLRQQMPASVNNYETGLLYRATDDGFTLDDLAAQTTGTNATPNMVFLIKTTDGIVFGVYASNEFLVGEFSSGYCAHPFGSDFIFSVNNDLVYGVTTIFYCSVYIELGTLYIDGNNISIDAGFNSASINDATYLPLLGTGSNSIAEVEVYALDIDNNDSLTTLTDFQYSGCTDPLACNYDAEADCDNGSCNFIQEGECDCLGNTLDACGVCGGNGTVAGCMDPLACNYDSEVDCSDDSCTYIPEGECDCLGNTLDECGVCGGSSIAGCMDPLACNYDSEVDCSDDSCTYIQEGECDCLGNTLDVCGVCGGSSVSGCTDPLACNYNQDAGCDDGSCSNEEGLLFPESATLDEAGDTWLKQYIPDNLNNFEAELLFRKTEDGSTAADFHANCDGIWNTVVLIKTTDGFVFGGYNQGTWIGSSFPIWQNLLEDNFLFSVNNEIVKVQDAPYVGFEYENSTYNHINYGPTFGGGHDLHVNSSLSGGYTRQFSYGGGNMQVSHFGGSYNSWVIQELEVYELKTSGIPISVIAISGCTNPLAYNYNESAVCDDDSCQLPEGCTDVIALNYNSVAIVDDGSCLYASGLNGDCVIWDAAQELFVSDPECASSCMGDMNGDSNVTASDLTLFLSVFGESCEE